jgi:protoporphyrinogen oxidase
MVDLPVKRMKLIKRRTFLKLAVGVSVGALFLKNWVKKKSILIFEHNSHSNIGHLLRKPEDLHGKKLHNSKDIVSKPVVIIGGGIAGLSAARKLTKAGIDFLLLELSDTYGGNAIHGSNDVTKYPWGAHYLPIPNLEQIELLDFLEEIKVIKSYEEGLPVYDEIALCSAPEERLYLHKHWQEGLIPEIGLNQKDHADLKAFFEIIQDYKKAVGSDQKQAFCIPIANCSKDLEFTQLDNITLKQFIKEKQLDSHYLNWYLNYCCKDDFGTPIEQTSAWAGIHYFAARKGIAFNAKSDDVLTWPEGNSFLSKGLSQSFEEKIHPNKMVTKIQLKNKEKVSIQYLDILKDSLYEIEANHVIVATPQYINTKIVSNYPQIQEAFEYYPWLIANITTAPLNHSRGIDLCWDNVIYQSESLGYINASHQLLQSHPIKHVFTYYYPLCKLSAKEERKLAYEKSKEEWAEWVLKDLETVHPDIREKAEDITIKIWGHAMISPKPGVIWNRDKEMLKNFAPNIHFAHSDLSGISIFEEAFYQGTMVADGVINAMNA